jgi:hypothetical protein
MINNYERFATVRVVKPPVPFADEMRSPQIAAMRILEAALRFNSQLAELIVKGKHVVVLPLEESSTVDEILRALGASVDWRPGSVHLGGEDKFLVVQECPLAIFKVSDPDDPIAWGDWLIDLTTGQVEGGLAEFQKFMEQLELSCPDLAQSIRVMCKHELREE